MGKIFFVGIGGVSMSAIALLLKSKGEDVAGSDQKESDYTKKLRDAGVTVYIGHGAAHITEDISLLVYNLAVPEDNPEIVRARELNIPIKARPTVLGEIMREYNTPICVAGTHGKTTATSMLTEIFLNAGKNPTALIGGTLPSIGGPLKIGGNEFFIAESCEYRDAFLSFFPKIGVILNIDHDHHDYFASFDQVISSFASFAEKIPEDGALIVFGGTDSRFFDAIADFPFKTLTYGIDESGELNYTVSARNVSLTDAGNAVFDAYVNGAFLTHATLSVTGEHNVLNALSAIAVCCSIGGFSPADISRGLLAFLGTKRRFELKGTLFGAEGGIPVYDDYAHHPAEVAATLNAAKALNRRVWCVFQPHTKKRTKELLLEFAESLSLADSVLLLPIYNPPGREETASSVDSLDLAAEIRKPGKSVYLFDDFDEATLFLSQNLFSKNLFNTNLLITMGAGDVTLLSETLILPQK
ncbi:UDP-N-acetylmuramate--L-alanine ligase [Clostridia bacterium]|nr:UDP-N-acetylmuramate--L-alanine ligase [Clostridia bacterium]